MTEVVARPDAPWTPAVHSLLRHLEARGFDGAPRVVTLADGTEAVTWVDGDVALPAPAADEAVAALARLLRRYHDAVEDFEPPPDARWQIAGAGDVICHNDLYGGNVVLREGLPVAFIDWEMAGPGTRVGDVAGAACFWAPLRRDEQARRSGIPTDRRRERLRLLCDEYGLDADARAHILDAAASYLRRGFELLRHWGETERRPKWREIWERGAGNVVAADLEWLAQNRAELQRALR